jgi:hypothetical protein
MPTLREKLDKLLAKQDLDDVVPALAAALAIAGVETKVSKRVFVAYVVEVIDMAFDRYEREMRDSQY